MPDGLIVKALSGYYYVLPEGGAPERLVQCRARGIFKKNGVTPLVGDKVRFETTENGEGTVDELYPRTSELIRPPIANVNLAVLVFSVDEPALNLQLLDKFLVHTEFAGLETIICLTKHDLLPDGSRGDVPVAAAAKAVRLYEDIGYEVLVTSALQSMGTERLAKRLEGAISVFSGQSGVGKSSLLNAMFPGLALETNSISSKLGRGKHTTRHVELIPLAGGGWVADTPGFSQLDFLQMEPEQLGACFAEFRPQAEGCKFRGCLHRHEPGCRVIEAVQEGRISRTRYDHYLLFLGEMRDRKRRY